ncbi:MAG: hypothetical protein OXF46_03420 [Rhodobacteraceae bacterium]|nr:hypothetical protein [Paracoccaceae bacterium]
MSNVHTINGRERVVKGAVKQPNNPAKVKNVTPTSERIIRQTSLKRKKLMMALADR